jgi:hypothetical protein
MRAVLMFWFSSSSSTKRSSSKTAPLGPARKIPLSDNAADRDLGTIGPHPR